jgi:3-oxo-4-pregnene-20-carboxyl-CoA dehydrogenase alpha subunit
VNPELPDEAVQFGLAADKAFASIGGVDAARQAEVDPDHRAGAVAKTLAGLGTEDVDPRSDLDSAAAAGELCRVAGRCALPYPVVSYLLRDPDSGSPFAVVPEGRLRVDHGDLFGEWRVASMRGDHATASPSGRRLSSKLGPFVADLQRTGEDRDGLSADLTMFLVLGGWRILGTAERALELAVDHVRGRVQFGQPLAAFQAVQFQLADASVGVDGLRELARYTLWRSFDDPSAALADALALRLHAIDVVTAVLRTSQQLHGAAGVCDEYDVSVLCRHAQPDMRLPFGSAAAATELSRAVCELGFEGLFPQGGGHDRNGGVSAGGAGGGRAGGGR